MNDVRFVFSASKTTRDVSDCMVSFALFLGVIIFISFRLPLNRASFFFFKILYCILHSSFLVLPVAVVFTMIQTNMSFTINQLHKHQKYFCDTFSMHPLPALIYSLLATFTYLEIQKKFRNTNTYFTCYHQLFCNVNQFKMTLIISQDEKNVKINH